jgi:hypothetical protein
MVLDLFLNVAGGKAESTTNFLDIDHAKTSKIACSMANYVLNWLFR